MSKHFDQEAGLPMFDAVRDYATARGDDPETSHEAACALTADTLRKNQQEVLLVLATFQKLPDYQLVERCTTQSPSGVRSRRAELRDGGLVRFSGEYVKHGRRRHRVWSVTERGMTAARRLREET